MSRSRISIILALILGTVLLLILPTSGIQLGSKTYYCKFTTWPNNPSDWPANFYYDTADGPTGSFESYYVFGVRVARWSWQFIIKN